MSTKKHLEQMEINEAKREAFRKTVKPCPFCGGQAVVTFNIHGLHSAWCSPCGFRGHGIQIEKWNQRVKA